MSVLAAGDRDDLDHARGEDDARHGDENVKIWRVFDRPWSDDDTARYVRRGSNGVVLAFRKNPEAIDLGFLRSLPNLRHVEIDGPIKDDSIPLELHDLLSLTLFTASKAAMSLEGLSKLKHLAIRSRPGLEAIASAEALESIMIGGFRGPDLRFLGAKPALRYLRLDCKFARMSLAGIEKSQGLFNLTIHDAIVESLAPLRGLTSMRDLTIVGAPGPWVLSAPWDLGDLVGMRHLETLRFASAGPVASLWPLRQLKSLRDVAIGRGVLDGDLSPLVDLPSGAMISVFDPQSNYSHSLEEIHQERERLGRSG